MLLCVANGLFLLTERIGKVRVCRRKKKGERSDEEILELDPE